jgi:glucuronokinase
VYLSVAEQGTRSFETLDEAMSAMPVCDGPGLLHAALRRSVEHGTRLEDGIELTAVTTIPTEVGLASSSALLIAALRALGTSLERDDLARCALAIETEDLGIAAGLQDRLVQSYGVPLHMNFATGVSEPLTAEVPELLIAWDPSAAAGSGGLHKGLRARFDAGEPEVIAAMPRLAAFADLARDAISSGDLAGLQDAMNGSFDIRLAIGASDARTIAMVQLARANGAAANSAGSGGAVVCCGDDLSTLRREFEARGLVAMHVGG